MALTPETPPLDPSANPYAREKIEGEIAHLRKRTSVRGGPGGGEHSSPFAWSTVLLVTALLALFLMDPVVHSFRRSEAIRAYLYLHSYGSDSKARKLSDSGIFSASELELLNHRQGTFQNYFAGPAQASQAADTIVGYLQGVANLHGGRYQELDLLGKIRYEMFVRWGLHPPKNWAMLDQSIQN